MSEQHISRLPQPKREAINIWLNRIGLDYLHDEGWEEINKKSHSITMGGRRLANELFPNDPDKREGFLAGMTYAQLANIHFSELEELAGRLAATDDSDDEKIVVIPVQRSESLSGEYGVGANQIPEGEPPVDRP